MQLGDKEARIAKKMKKCSTWLVLINSLKILGWGHVFSLDRSAESCSKVEFGLVATSSTSWLFCCAHHCEVLRELSKCLKICKNVPRRTTFGGFWWFSRVCRVRVSCVWLFFYLLDSALFSPRMWTWRNGCQMCPKNISIFPVLKRNWISWGSQRHRNDRWERKV